MTQPLLSHLPPGTAVIHLGAHHGQEAARYSTHGSPVLWVEACPLFLPQLERNLRAYPQQTWRQGALAERSGQRRVFHISNNMEGVSSSFHAFGPAAQELWPDLNLHHVRSLPVITTTLDTLLEQETIWIQQYQPTALVVDVQGAELEVLMGSLGSLWRFHWIQVESSSVSVYTTGNTRQRVDALLRGAGFELVVESEQRPGHGDRLYVRHNLIPDPDPCFGLPHYQEINHARLQHLQKLPLPLQNRSVLELGSGPGDLSGLFLDRGCSVTSVDGRPENIQAAAQRHQSSGQWNGFCYDLCQQLAPSGIRYDVIVAYGILYHLADPYRLLQAASVMQPELLLLETCVTPEYRHTTTSSEHTDPVHLVEESALNGSQSMVGLGSRPDRRWLWRSLQDLFPYVYSCPQQPHHSQFPNDWRPEALPGPDVLTRMTFIASSEPLSPGSGLLEGLPLIQQGSLLG